MAIQPKDAKLLWGRAAGLCSRPDCRRKLTAVGAEGVTFLVGEMAHQIAQKPGGPRGVPGGGSDTYENLILLCPTHHTEIDKAPIETFPHEMLAKWKTEHESWVDSWGNAPSFDGVGEMAIAIHEKLLENRVHWEAYGPRSEGAQNNPASNIFVIWTARKLDSIIPNNSAISRILKSNWKLLPKEAQDAAIRFQVHATAFEQHQYERLEEYPLFPRDFSTVIEGLLDE
ncbi:hypothetical protein [uncultured Tateyamaria sp.]|uniref:hypothetical protein n=1 Tax=uncultured Tateyamaria sp. TaxID=455651 RepID=UPI002609D77B|nr:hypothetical protein [uncultured Tateyamaria sp.]